MRSPSRFTLVCERRDDDGLTDTAALENDVAELLLGCADLEFHRDKALERVAALEAALRRMHASILGGSICDPQQIADELRQIAAEVGVDVGQ